MRQVHILYNQNMKIDCLLPIYKGLIFAFFPQLWNKAYSHAHVREVEDVARIFRVENSF